MVKESVVISHAQGLHARPASQLAKIASGFKSDLLLIKDCDGSEADCRSILSLLVLAAGNGTKLTLHADGEDELEAAKALAEFFRTGFGGME